MNGLLERVKRRLGSPRTAIRPAAALCGGSHTRTGARNVVVNVGNDLDDDDDHDPRRAVFDGAGGGSGRGEAGAESRRQARAEAAHARAGAGARGAVRRRVEDARRGRRADRLGGESPRGTLGSWCSY